MELTAYSARLSLAPSSSSSSCLALCRKYFNTIERDKQMRFDELGKLAAVAGHLTDALCEPWDGQPESDQTQIIIRNLVKEFFDSFSRTLTDDDLRIMMHLDICRLCQSSNLIKHVHNSITSIDRVMEASLRDEFERRIDFLIAHGLISPASGKKVCISHLGKSIVRVFKERRKLPPEKDSPRPRAFIGSSSEGLPIARKLQFLLQDDLGCVLWNQGTVFGLGEATIESLESAVHAFSFGIFVLTPDDKIISRKTTKKVGRDNVLFELGLFIGKLSRRRAFLVHHAKQAISLPSDLYGMASAKYDPVDVNDEVELAISLGPVAEQIRNAVRQVRRESETMDCA
jgi:predicted nucleotide-binding protein